MKRFLLAFIVFFIFPNQVKSEHLSGNKELIIKTESTEYALSLAEHLTKKGIVKYSAYWCPHCLHQAELFGKKAYKELTVVECSNDGINSQTQKCVDKNIEGFPTWEINGELTIGVKSLKELANESNFKRLNKT